MEYKGYRSRVEFDQEAGVLFGEVEGLRDVVTFEATTVDALQKAFHASVDDYLAMCSEQGEEPERPYSGKFLMRMDPGLHREFASAAARAGKSLNQFASEALRAALAAAHGRPKLAPEPRVYPSAIMAAPMDLARSVLAEATIPSRWAVATRHTPSALTPNTPNQQITPQSQTPARVAA